VNAVQVFYEVQDSVERFNEDVLWLAKSWNSHTESRVIFLPDIHLAPAVMAAQVAQLYRSSALTRTFASTSDQCGSITTGSWTLRQLLGRLAGDVRINDIIMHAAMHAICRRFRGCASFDPVALRNRAAAVALPDAPLVAHRCIFVPVFRPGMAHWLLQVITIGKREGPRPTFAATVHMYDPLALQSNFTDLRKVWMEYTRPLLQAWHHRNTVASDAGSVEGARTDTSAVDGRLVGPREPGENPDVQFADDTDHDAQVGDRDVDRRGGDRSDNIIDTDGQSANRSSFGLELDGIVTIAAQSASRTIRRRRSLRMSDAMAEDVSVDGVKQLEQSTPKGSNVRGEIDAPFPPFDRVEVVQVAQPVQHDAVSCGVYCVAQAHSFADDSRVFEADKSATPTDIEVVRLRLLWELTVGANAVEHDSSSDWIAVEKIGKHVSRYFRAAKTDAKVNASKKK